MAIQIKELLPSDSLANALDKINYNFDQLILSGGGPAGPIGLQGLQGNPGSQGERGSRWWTETLDGATSGLTGATGVVEGDLWLSSDGDVWEFGTTQWTYTNENIKGDKGDAGDAGVGSPFVIYEGAGTPWKPNPGSTAHAGGITESDFITLDVNLHGGYNVETLLLGSVKDFTPSTDYNIGLGDIPRLMILQKGVNYKNGISIGIGSTFSTGDIVTDEINSEDFAFIGIDENAINSFQIWSSQSTGTDRSLELYSDNNKKILIGVDDTAVATGNNIYLKTNSGKFDIDSDVRIRNGKKLSFVGASSFITGFTKFSFDGINQYDYKLPVNQNATNKYLTGDGTQLQWSEIGFQFDGTDQITTNALSYNVSIGDADGEINAQKVISNGKEDQTPKLLIVGDGDQASFISHAKYGDVFLGTYQNSTLSHRGQYLSILGAGNSFGTANTGYEITDSAGVEKLRLRYYKDLVFSGGSFQNVEYSELKATTDNLRIEAVKEIQMRGNTRINAQNSSNDYVLALTQGNANDVLISNGDGTTQWSNLSAISAASVWTAANNQVSLTNAASEGVVIDKDIPFVSPAQRPPLRSLHIRDRRNISANDPINVGTRRDDGLIIQNRTVMSGGKGGNTIVSHKSLNLISDSIGQDSYNPIVDYGDAVITWNSGGINPTINDNTASGQALCIVPSQATATGIKISTSRTDIHNNLFLNNGNFTMTDGQLTVQDGNIVTGNGSLTINSPSAAALSIYTTSNGYGYIQFFNQGTNSRDAYIGHPSAADGRFNIRNEQTSQSGEQRVHVIGSDGFQINDTQPIKKVYYLRLYLYWNGGNSTSTTSWFFKPRLAFDAGLESYLPTGWSYSTSSSDPSGTGINRYFRLSHPSMETNRVHWSFNASYRSSPWNNPAYTQDVDFSVAQGTGQSTIYIRGNSNFTSNNITSAWTVTVTEFY